jgi:metal-responsive CopG/Arc/MetJ family transcriptional regulator
MATELVTFKMESRLLKDVDETVKQAGFQNRTEFIRNALREKVDEVKLKEAMKILSKMRGKAPRIVSDEERARVREEVFQEMEKELKIRPRV